MGLLLISLILPLQISYKFHCFLQFRSCSIDFLRMLRFHLVYLRIILFILTNLILIGSLWGLAVEVHLVLLLIRDHMYALGKLDVLGILLRIIIWSWLLEIERLIRSTLRGTSESFGRICLDYWRLTKWIAVCHRLHLLLGPRRAIDVLRVHILLLKRRNQVTGVSANIQIVLRLWFLHVLIVHITRIHRTQFVIIELSWLLLIFILI